MTTTNDPQPLGIQPVVIIGAGRSGTNILRDVLTTIDGLGTWPCDEINYIWRHGNVRYPSDEFPRQLARPEVRRYIRGAFRKIAKKYDLRQVVEKTCANSLRVGFVDAILPEARFIHILRDGRDVVASAKLRWTAELDLPYLARKARWVPPSDLPYYGLRYLWNRIYRLRSNDGRLAFWGPRFDGVDEALQRMTLEEVCALQWKRCVENASRDLGALDPGRVHTIRYEAFANDPRSELRRLAEFLGVTIAEGEVDRCVASVRKSSVGKWRKDLAPEVVADVERVCGDTLAAYGYA